MALSDRWLQFWVVLRPRITGNVRCTHDVKNLVAGSRFLDDWVQDFGDALREASLDDLKYAEAGLATLREILDAFPDEDREVRLHLRTELAQLHYVLGRDAEGERLFMELIADEPDLAEGWSCFADELSFCEPGTGTPRDLDRAIALLEQALARPVGDAKDWELEARLEEYRRQRNEIRRRGRTSSRRRLRRSR